MSRQSRAKRIQERKLNRDLYVERVEKKKTSTKSPDQLKLLINPEDTPKNPLTHARLMEWLADTGWVEGYIRKRINPLSVHLIDDFTQSIWLVILTRDPEYIMKSWYTGKGYFVNLIKRIIDIQLIGVQEVTFLENKRYHLHHFGLTDDQWRKLENGELKINYSSAYPEYIKSPTGNKKKNCKVAINEEVEGNVETELYDY